MRSLIYLICVVVTMLCFSCRKEAKISVADKINPKRMPTMTTKKVATFISDSGIVQYKIVSPVWYVYDAVDTPFWNFPEGIYLRKYDRSFRVISSVAADSARYFKHDKIWRLDGHVELKNVPKELFMTSQLFWNERRGELYSDSFIHIETPTHVIEGYGFVSNDRLTSYRIIKPTGIFPVDPEYRNGSPGSSARDVETTTGTSSSAMQPGNVITTMAQRPQ